MDGHRQRYCQVASSTVQIVRRASQCIRPCRRCIPDILRSGSRIPARTIDRLRYHFRHLFEPGVAPEVQSVDDFIALLIRYFKDPATQSKAEIKLHDLAQRSLAFITFLTEFEDTMIESRWADEDKNTVWLHYLLNRLSDGLHDIYVHAFGTFRKIHEAASGVLRERNMLQDFEEVIEEARNGMKLVG